ncbi:MAG: malonyl-CoA decarboxylase, partial [Pseudomonadota bacterium]
SGTKVASAVLAKYDTLDNQQKSAFFECLADDYDLEPDLVIDAARQYSADRSPGMLENLIEISEPRRQKLMHRLNQVPGGTEKLVHMREDLMPLIKERPEFALVDSDFEHVFSTWFNRGFLVLKPIDWRTPANILEKIIEYEAVHAINDWDDLRRRLQPEDRRCFAFFHPAMPEEPLIFVEVALTKGAPDSIASLLAETREVLHSEMTDTAVFYSISNCQTGLKGVSFGNFLIKQVVNDLKQEVPGLKNFVTLSPVPGFTKWFLKQHGETEHPDLADIVKAMGKEDTEIRRKSIEPYEKELTKLMAEYLFNAKWSNGMPLDPVARFHLGNGASLMRINWMADQSPNGIRQSAGMMVNYKYDLATVENNHESYVNDREVHTTREIKVLAKTELK